MKTTILRRALSVAGCFALLAASGRDGAAGDADVSVQLFQFRPATVTVKPGTRVTWTNRDDIQHTVTAGTPEQREGTFALALDGAGATASMQFSTPGVHPYFCERHPDMRGEVRIE